MVEVKDNIQDAEQLNKNTNKKSKDAIRSLAYFWDYYKWYVIIPILSIIVIVSICMTLYQEHKDMYLTVCFANVTTECDDILKSYEELISDTIRVEFDYLHPKVSDPYYVNDDGVNASVQKLQSGIASGRVDVLCTNTRAIDEYSVNGAFVDLRQICGEAFISEYADYIYYVNDIPIGIDVDASEILSTAYLDSEEKHYLVVTKFTDKVDRIEALIDYLY